MVNVAAETVFNGDNTVSINVEASGAVVASVQCDNEAYELNGDDIHLPGAETPGNCLYEAA